MIDMPASPVAEGWRRDDAKRPRSSGFAGALRARLRGPGGYYNIGNVVALATGLLVQVSAVPDAGGERPGAVMGAVRAYLVGSPGATALTVAILVFFVSGEFYHRAWARGCPPDRRMKWWGDFLSGVAAVVLTFALAAFGDLLLALLSGWLLALGKFGSALVPEGDAVPGRGRLPWIFRVLVVASRVPALAALGLQLAMLTQAHATPAAFVMPGVMFACYLLWARADTLLFAGARNPEPEVAE